MRVFSFLSGSFDAWDVTRRLGTIVSRRFENTVLLSLSLLSIFFILLWYFDL
jgi:hypothetical protein